MSDMRSTNGEMRLDEAQEEHIGEVKVNKYCYILLALFFGDLGIHMFYAKKIKKGVLYLLFCWTFIPAILSLFDIIKACGKMKDLEDRIWV